MMKFLNAFLFVLFASSASARVGSTHRFLKAAENGHSQGIPGEYVVLLEQNADPRGILTGLIQSGKAEELQVYENAVRGFAVRMNLNALENALKHVEGVLITENQVIVVGSVQTPVVSWGIDRVDQRISKTNEEYVYERDGSNVDVYIVDTGIDTSHEDFEGRASFGVDVSGSGEGDNDNNGHGTHVAGKFDQLLQYSYVSFITFWYLTLLPLPFQELSVGPSTGLRRRPT
jgi:subtilisin family serine protease